MQRSELSAGELWYGPPFPLSQTPVHSPVWFRFCPSDPERPLYSFTLVMSFASLSLVLFPELPLFGCGFFQTVSDFIVTAFSCRNFINLALNPSVSYSSYAIFLFIFLCELSYFQFLMTHFLFSLSLFIVSYSSFMNAVLSLIISVILKMLLCLCSDLFSSQFLFCLFWSWVFSDEHLV